MPDIQPNFIALLIATVAGFFLSFVWYSVLFGKAWAKEMGFDPDEKQPTAVMVKSLLLTILAVFLIVLVMSNNIAAWTPSSWGIKDVVTVKYSQALQAGGFTWLGFFVSNLLMGVAWEKRSWKLFAIDAGYYLALLFLVAFIIVYMR
jgi:Protein of unknown function (DUF1761)